MKSLEKLFPFLFLTQLASIVYSIALAQFLYFVLLILWIVILVREKKWTLNVYDALFGAFVFLRITAMIFSEYPSASSTAFFREIIFYPYYFIAVYFLRTQRKAGLKKSMEVILYAAVIPSLYAVGMVLTHAVERGASFSGGYSVFAVHGAFTITFGLLLLLEEHRQKKKLLYLAVIALVTGAVLITYTRAMWISVMLSFLFIGLAGYKKILAGLTGAGIAVVAFSPSLQERFLSLLDPVHNSSGRLELWSAGVKLVPVHFFLGFGPETFGSIAGDRSRFPDPNINSWHNEFLHVCIESGIFSVIVLAALYAFALFLLIRLFPASRKGPGPFRDGFCFTALTMLVIIPSILFGSIMLSILNGMILKFVLAGYSYIAEDSNVIQPILWRFRS